MAYAERVGEAVHITSSYHQRHLTAQIPGASYKKDLGVWAAPLTWATCMVLRGVFKDDLTIGDELQAWAWKERAQKIVPAMKLRDALHADITYGPSLDWIERNQQLKLFPYQRVDVDFLATNERAVLANPMGLGKTPVAIRTLQLMRDLNMNPFPALIICPNSLKYTVWEEDFKKWAPEVTVQVVDGTAVKRRKQLEAGAMVYVLNWDAVRLHSRIAPYGDIALTDKDREEKELNSLGHRSIVFDEAHKLSNPKAKWTRACWYVAHQAVYRFALTGTPVRDNIGDLWSILHTIEPDWFRAKTKFLDRYAQFSYNYFGGNEVIGINPVNRSELFCIIDPIMRRIPKEAALPQLPPKLPVQYRHTPMSAKQAKAYAQMRELMIAQLNEILVAVDPLSKLTRLLQFAAASAEVDDEGGLHLSDPSGKVDDLIDLLEEMGDEPLVVAAVSRQLIELAAKRLEKHKISYGLVTGAQSALERQGAVKDFQEGRTRVILLTLGAGAEGITLTRANTMLFMQRSYSEVQNMQGEDRIHRIGSEHHAEVRIIEQITPGTVEENRIDLLRGKQWRMEDVMRDAEALKKLLGAG
jgi:SNF2 family DNA or RNA helicase